jgi:hypothetical protein
MQSDDVMWNLESIEQRPLLLQNQSPTHSDPSIFDQNAQYEEGSQKSYRFRLESADRRQIGREGF